MVLIRISEEEQLKCWIKGLNEAFKDRSTKYIPYSELKENELLTNEGISVYGLYNNENKLIGGICIEYEVTYNNIRIAKLSRVWRNTKYKHQGIGTILLDECEKIVFKKNVQMLQLDVANIYEPAVLLYEKNGFKKYQIYANVPGTYYFIRMIKPIGTFHFATSKRFFSLIKSKAIFIILFRRDSSPTVINKKLYKKLKKK